jgi:hypothetical protein
MSGKNLVEADVRSDGGIRPKRRYNILGICQFPSIRKQQSHIEVSVRLWLDLASALVQRS